MARIYIGFSKAKGFKPYGWAIQKLLSTPFSHVYVKFYSKSYDRDIIYQASSSMVNFMSPAIVNRDHVMIEEFEFKVSDETMTQVVQFAIDHAGIPYGFKAAVGMGIVRICDLFGYKRSNPFKDDGNTYVCSELAGAILVECLGEKLPVELDDLSPLEMYNYLKSTKKS